MNLFLKIFDKLSPHRAIMYGAVGLLMLLCMVSALRMDYNEDISAFMPFDKESAKYAEVFKNMSGQSTIAVIFNDNSNAALEEKISNIQDGIESFGSAIVKRDKNQIIRNLRIRVDETAMLDMLDFVWQTYPLLLTDDDYRQMDSLMNSRDYLQQHIEQNRLMLMLPTGGFMAQSLPYDPLHLSADIPGKLQQLNVNSAYRTVDGYLMKDSAGIVLFDSPFGMSESGNNTELQKLIDSCVCDVTTKHNVLSITAVGAPLIAVTNARQIKEDSRLAISLAVILILLVLFFSFRRIGDLIWIGISVFVGWLFALGAIALMRDGISLIAIGIGSIIIGIAVNYPLHFIEHLKHETDMREALKEMIPPLLIGNITTVSAFLCLILLDSQAMRDLGLFGALTLVGTILFVLICLPVFLNHRKARPAQTNSSFSLGKLHIPTQNKRIKQAVFCIVVALTCIFGYLSVGTSFDSNMQNINYMLPEQREGLKFLASNTKSNNDSLNILFAVAEGKTLDEALHTNETMIDGINGISGIRQITGIAGLIPSDSLCAVRMAEWNEFWTKHHDILNQLSTTATQNGFAQTAFNPFIELVQNKIETIPTTENPIYKTIGRNFVMHSTTGYKIINYLHIDSHQSKEIRAEINAAIPDSCFVFAQADVQNHLIEVLSNSFDYIGWVCGLVVFIFLCLSFRSIELSLMSFLPLAISWIWILGIMQILGMKFNIVNIILATLIFGQGDDYTIFITEGLMYEYTTGKKRLETYKNSVALSAVIMFVGIGTLIFSKHPAMRSLAEVAIVGMITVIIMTYYLPPLVFRWLTEKDGKRREYPVTLYRLWASLVAIVTFLCGSFLVVIPYINFVYRPLKKTVKRERHLHWLIQRGLGFVLHHIPGVKFTVENPTGETFEKPAVITCNHQSLLDLPAILHLSPKIVVLTNERTWNNPFYRQIIRAAECYPITNGYDDTLLHLKGLIERGYSVVVFPEGTRTLDGNIGRFHRGAFCLAKDLGIDILPLYIHGMFDILPKYDFMMRRGSTTLNIGERIGYESFADQTHRTMAIRIHRQYIEKYAEMCERLETPEYRAPYEAYKKKYTITTL